MKHRYYIVASILLIFTLAVPSLAAGPPVNLVIGVGAPLNSSGSWSNYSAINVISGSSLLPFTSTTTVLYIGFTGGSFADIDNMVLYTTKRDNNKITAVTPVKFKGMSNPSINLTNSTCPTQPLSNANPCIVRLDPIALSLSTLSDYYFVVHFAANSNNNSLQGAVPDFINRTSLTGGYQGGDDTRLRVGQTVPSANSGYPFFLMLVMNN